MLTKKQPRKFKKKLKRNLVNNESESPIGRAKL